MVFVRSLEMSIFYYFGLSASLPNPRNSSRSLPSAAIVSANTEVMHAMSEAATLKKRKAYNQYTPKERAMIGKYTAQNGVVRAKSYFRRKYNWEINEGI